MRVVAFKCKNILWWTVDSGHQGFIKVSSVDQPFQVWEFLQVVPAWGRWRRFQVQAASTGGWVVIGHANALLPIGDAPLCRYPTASSVMAVRQETQYCQYIHGVHPKVIRTVPNSIWPWSSYTTISKSSPCHTTLMFFMCRESYLKCNSELQSGLRRQLTKALGG